MKQNQTEETKKTHTLIKLDQSSKKAAIERNFRRNNMNKKKVKRIHRNSTDFPIGSQTDKNEHENEGT